MRFRTAKTLIQAKTNNFNLYRGCTHGCIYCDSRSECYQIDGDFEDVIVKENACELAKIELSKKRKKIVIHTGSMSDPYVHLEKELKLMRCILEVVYEYGHGIGFITKSALALRDLDLFQAINKKSKVIACYTLTTVNDKVAKMIEPYVSLPSERLQALKAFRESNITTGVWMTPLLPGITATKENIKRIVEACASVGVTFIVAFGMGTTMRAGSRDYFYQKLDELYPGLKERYQSYYGNQYICDPPNHEELWEVFRSECMKYRILINQEEIWRLYKLDNDERSLFSEGKE